jgi:thiamine kinase-like enzyme
MSSLPSPSFPFDDVLPGVSVLLDADQMRLRVQEGFGVHGRLARLRICGYEFVPHVSLRVHYTAEVGTLRYDLTAQVGHPVPDAKTIEKLTTSARDRRVARLPVARLADLSAQLSWYPIDFGLPHLALPDVELADTVGLDSAGPTSQFSWIPGQRAVVRFPNALVRVYHDAADAQRSSEALRMVEGHLPIARMTSSNAEEGLVAQELRPGRVMLRDKAAESSSAAAQFIEQLHTVEPDTIDPNATLVSKEPADVVAAAEATVAFVAFCRPDLAERLNTLLARIRTSAPTGLPTVPSHGDFTFQNVLRNGEDLYVVDIDTLCLAPRAQDLAAYAVSLMNGRSEDFDDISAAVKAMRSVYTADPAGIDWFVAAFMLGSIDRPLRGLSRDWSERTDSWLATAERCAA